MSTYDPFELQVQQAAAASATQESEREARQAAEHLRAVVSTLPGRRVLWSVLVDSGLFRSSYTGGDGTIFNEGMRNVGLRLVARIRAACPDDYLRMFEENA
ncbi:MAG: hypothetical protein BGO13_08675 [Burkholderiales bacterium 66-5]|nr:MAG: hypothetical protein BGO13_08675 [Burkholderiales bacterium 66-5]